MNKVPNRIINQDLEDKLSSLFALHRFGIKPGLERISNLLQLSGNPHTLFSTIHVAGTNGKGSVSSMIASILTDAGLKTGLYTSPHIVRFNERIRIDGKQIDDDSISALAEKYMHLGRDIESTFFEITTAMAFDYFANSDIDIAVIEAGMGGLNDATNVLSPLLSVITNVTLEHTEYLGDTIEKIADDKAGIIKPGIPVVCGSMSDDAMDVMLRTANKNNSELIDSKNKFVIDAVSNYQELNRELIVDFHNRQLKIELPLPGKHQSDNLVTALASVEFLKKYFPITNENIEDGIRNIFRNTGLRARIELLRSNPALILDAAHNPEGIESLVNTLQEIYPDAKFSIVFAAMQDKDITRMLRFLNRIASKYIFAELDNDRASSGDSNAALLNDSGIQYEICSPEKAIEMSFNSKERFLFTGTFYLAEQVLKYIENNNLSN